MKRTRQLLLVGLMAIAAIALNSCDETETILDDPTVVVTVTPADDQGLIEGVAGEQVTFDIDVTAPGGFNVLRVTEETDVATNTLFERSKAPGSTLTSFDTTMTYTLNANATSLQITAVDDNNGTAQEEFTFDVTDPITTYTAVLLGGPGNPQVGSFYNAISNEVYLVNDAFTNASQVDFLYFFGNTSQNAIAATDDSNAETAFDAQADIDLTTMTTRNPTRFKPLPNVTVADFDAIAGRTDLLNTFGQDIAADASLLTDLAVDDVFGFTLAQDRDNITGMAKVTEIVSTSPEARSITLEIKLAL